MNYSIKKPFCATAVVFLCMTFTEVSEAHDTQQLAKQLANPVASLISVPLQFNYDEDIGANDAGKRTLLNVQPVIPFTLNDEWNLISRTILPVISQQDIAPGTDQEGLGDTLQSLFFSPSEPNTSGWIWGAGPAFSLPTATDDLLGQEQWTAGPTAVALKQKAGLTYGALINQLWKVAGDGDREDVNAMFFQPFVSYTTANALTLGLNTESVYNWKSNEWGVPVNATVSQVLKVGGQLVSVGGGVRYWADSNDGTGEGIGYRLTITLLFPR